MRLYGMCHEVKNNLMNYIMKLLSDYFEVKSELKNPVSPVGSNTPTSQQLKVINAPFNSNLSIIACAGSGKTTTLINRISNLVKTIHPTSIILTTFTRDAAKDMTKKLDKKLGKENGVYVGTMDSLSLYFLRNYDALEEGMQNVGEYAVHFLNFLRNNDKRKMFFSSKKYLFVDEFQDINQLQFEIINEFYKNNIIVIGVGDDAQNIYTFRGSDVKYIINFTKLFENSEQHFLTNNFRSTKEIVEVANESIQKAQYCIPKKMVPQSNYSGEKPEVRFFEDQDSQADFILSKIYQLRKNIPYEEMCVLCPINQMLYKLEEKALQNNLPINILDNKNEVGISGIRKGKVTMCTIHKSKGLEWDVVFVIGMNDELFPAEKELDKIEEARRLFYVATTRARKFLYYTFTPVGKSRKVSRFIGELPLSIINFIGYRKEFIEISNDEHISKKNGVVEKIENLQIEDITYLRKKNILPQINDVNFYDVHNAISLPKFIYDQNLLADIGIFVDCVLSRELAINYNEHPRNFSCQCCLANIHIDIFSYKIYLENRAFIEEYINTKNKNILDKLDSKITLIIDKIIKSAKKNRLNPLDVGVFPNSFLPKNWRNKFEESYNNYKNINLKSIDIIQDIWNISLCSQIVNNNRRKMLYINVPLEKIIELGENVIKNYPKFLNNGNNIIIHKHYAIPGLCGEIDFWKDNALFDIKMSHEKKVDLNWVMQLMCYKGMMDIDVEQFYIYNVMSGKLIEIPNIEKNNCIKLVKYLSQK